MDLIVTEAALAAAREWSTRSGAHLPEPVIHGLIEAALPHLTTRDGIDAEYWTEKLDVLTNAVDKLTDLVVDHRAECERLAATPAPQGAVGGREDAAYQRGYNAALWRVDDAYRKGKAAGEASELYPAHWGFPEIEAERRHRERMAIIKADPGKWEARAREAAARAVTLQENLNELADRVAEAVTLINDICPPANAVNLTTTEQVLVRARALLTGDPFSAEHRPNGPAAPTSDLILNCPSCGAGQPDLHAKDCPRYDAARTFPGVNPDGTGTGEYSGRAGG